MISDKHLMILTQMMIEHAKECPEDTEWQEALQAGVRELQRESGLYVRLQGVRDAIAQKYTDEHPLIHIHHVLDLIDGLLVDFDIKK